MKLFLFSFLLIFVESCDFSSDPINNAEDNVVTLKLLIKEGQELYFKYNSWGISGNHNRIVLTNNISTIMSKETDYVFYTPTIFYRLDVNELLIYAPLNLTSIPSKSFKGCKVTLHDLKTSADIEYYKKNYKKLELKKVTVYKE